MEERLDECRTKLEGMLKAENFTAMVPVLKDLKTMAVTKDSIQRSKIGVLVNKLRKQETGNEVTKLATSILIDWKKILTSDEVPVKVTEEKKPGSPPPPAIVSLADYELFQQFKTGDFTRDKCIEMLVTALCTDTPECLQGPDELILGTAAGVEKALFHEFNAVDVKYKTKFRSKYLNLKDKANPQLRAILLQGIISPAQFAAMTAAEMASEERRASDLALQEENLKNTKAAQDTSAETDQFKCGRCKQRKCKYYQLQTRSADEPMTTFVTCINCNNRWKFC